MVERLCQSTPDVEAALLRAAYAPRDLDPKIKALVGGPEMTGRLARFTFTPQMLPVAQMGRITPANAHPA